jgi:phosphate transport system substrate-binding protein
MFKRMLKMFFVGFISFAMLITMANVSFASAPLIVTDGSSTVFPITEAVAEEFMKAKRGAIRVTVGVSGTGGGFKKFCRGETVVQNASRPIRDAERHECARAGIEFISLLIGYDGLSVVVNPKNDWARSITTAELKRIWEPAAERKITHWNQVRAGWPNRPLSLYGPDTASGTFDYFTEEIVGEAKASRADYMASADDHVLVMGVAGDVNALGYFGYAYYVANRDRVRALAIDAGKGPIAPTFDTIADGTYSPLSRPLFIYVNAKALKDRPEVREFVEFYLKNATELVREVGYIPAADAVYRAGLERVRR